MMRNIRSGPGISGPAWRLAGPSQGTAWALVLLALLGVAGATEVHGKVCEAVHNTTCALGTATCAKSPYSATGWGCCPLPGGVDCGTPLGTCCPAGTTCSKTGTGWEIVVSCVPAEGIAAASPRPGVPVCKPGPLNRMSATTKNCLVIGDSVSLGYTPFLAAALAEDCVVQHGPDGGDGGAEETAYGLECLDYFLSNPDGTPVHPDLILFNFGLHDGPCNGANTTIPGGAGTSAVYSGQLKQIATKLKAYTAATQAKLLFALTTPMLNSGPVDALVQSLNSQAAATMAAESITTVDLHAAIIGKCGKAPQAQCFGSAGCFSPHCPGACHITNCQRSVVAGALHYTTACNAYNTQTTVWRTKTLVLT